MSYQHQHTYSPAHIHARMYKHMHARTQTHTHTTHTHKHACNCYGCNQLTLNLRTTGNVELSIHTHTHVYENVTFCKRFFLIFLSMCTCARTMSMCFDFSTITLYLPFVHTVELTGCTRWYVFYLLVYTYT